MSANAALTNNTGQSRAAASQITMPSGELSTTRRQASADQLFMCRVRRPASGRGRPRRAPATRARASDRKSTRLNSSHEWISYAVFCLKKKKKQNHKKNKTKET